MVFLICRLLPSGHRPGLYNTGVLDPQKFGDQDRLFPRPDDSGSAQDILDVIPLGSSGFDPVNS